MEQIRLLELSKERVIFPIEFIMLCDGQAVASKVQ